MKYIIIIPVIIILVFFALAIKSRSDKPPGLVDGKLQQCSGKPNCLCSEFENMPKHFYPPIDYSQALNLQQIKEHIKKIVQTQGGDFAFDKANYLAFTFSSKLFGFVDDLEFKIDEQNKKLHVRSASRVGYSDGGVNKKRLDKLIPAIKNGLH